MSFCISLFSLSEIICGWCSSGWAMNYWVWRLALAGDDGSRSVYTSIASMCSSWDDTGFLLMADHKWFYHSVLECFWCCLVFVLVISRIHVQPLEVSISFLPQFEVSSCENGREFRILLWDKKGVLFSLASVYYMVGGLSYYSPIKWYFGEPLGYHFSILFYPPPFFFGLVFFQSFRATQLPFPWGRQKPSSCPSN